MTPANKGRTQDMTFRQGNDRAIASRDGERLALETVVPFGPNPDIVGTRAVFTRNSESGWEMKSVVAPEASGTRIFINLFSPDLSMSAFEAFTRLNATEFSADNEYDVGPVGGPYKSVASIPRQYTTELLGASADFSHVVLASTDHAVLEGSEGAVAEGTVEGAANLYDWTDGHLHLVNINSEGSLVNQCGANLGQQAGFGGEGAVDAVSEDGSKIFFTSPGNNASRLSGPGCTESARLYMRVGDSKTIEVSAPAPGVVIKPSEYREARYNDATPSGSEVFFNTETPLTGETSEEKERGLKNKLFEYDTVTGVLTQVASGVEESKDRTPQVVISEDGSTVYYENPASNGRKEINRYDVSTGGPSNVVATIGPPRGPGEPSYTTPNGEFFLFAAHGRSGEPGVVGEPRGAGHNELYRYDSTDGSVICVSCGPHNAPAEGEVFEPVHGGTPLLTSDETPRLIPMSGDGRYVFFQTSAQLVPQDTNVSTVAEEETGAGSLGQDVYEWEADGTGTCVLVEGCTFLLSSGEDVGPSSFLGASANGRDVFFSTAAQLVPQDTDEFSDIYDARIEGGFPPPAPSPECLSCHGVGSLPPLFNVPASGSFVGAGNPTGQTVTTVRPTRAQELAKALRSCRKKRLGHKRAACERQAKRRYAATGSKAVRPRSRTQRGH